MEEEREPIRMDPELYEAARSGDVVHLESIQDKALLSQLTPKENTILHISAEFSQPSFFRTATELLSEIKESATNPSPPSLLNQNSRGDTPLHVAAQVGCTEVVSFIIEQSKVLYKDVEDGQLEGYKKFLRMENDDGDNSLHCAARGGHSDVVKLLIEADGELSGCLNKAKESPFYIAAAKEYSDIAELILRTSSSSHGGTNGMTVLHAALYNHLKDLMKKLVEERPGMIKQGDNIGWTPLHYAAHFGNVYAVKLFLQKDKSAAYLLVKDWKYSALHIAAFRGRINVMKKLIKSCPDCFELVDNKKRTALHAAVLGGQENSVNFILGRSQLVRLLNEADEDGNTPLHLTALHRKYNIIAILARDSRVDIRATNKNNLTALGIYSKYQESGFAAAKVFFMLKETYGIQDVQAWVSTHLQKMQADKVPQETVTMEEASNSILSQKRHSSSIPEKGNMLEIHLLVAVLIATVTFAAAFTLPGGFEQNNGPDQGMAVLSSKVAFKIFVIFDTLAFCCSVAAVYLQFGTSGGGYYERARFVNVAMILIFTAILAMVLAFASGIYVVLAKNVGLGLTAFIVVGCFILTFCVRWFIDPLGNPDLGMRPLRKYVRNLLFQCGII